MGSLIARRHSLHRESEESFIHSSQDVVESYMSEVIDCITRSVSACPLALRIVLRNTYLRVRFKWSHETYEVEYCFICSTKWIIFIITAIKLYVWIIYFIIKFPWKVMFLRTILFEIGIIFNTHHLSISWIAFIPVAWMGSNQRSAT